MTSPTLSSQPVVVAVEVLHAPPMQGDGRPLAGQHRPVATTDIADGLLIGPGGSCLWSVS